MNSYKDFYIATGLCYSFVIAQESYYLYVEYEYMYNMYQHKQDTFYGLIYKITGDEVIRISIEETQPDLKKWMRNELLLFPFLDV